jgi:tRNA pseudouridine55 synthase
VAHPQITQITEKGEESKKEQFDSMTTRSLSVYARNVIGALIIDKPQGFTSHDVVARVRRAIGTRRVGHAGTLDPFATGVLVCCIGRATRLVQFLVGLDKAYIGTVRFGYATDTQDATGKQITPLRTSKELSLEELRKTLSAFIGPQLQTPPMFSAKKVGGKRLYKAAREGLELAREPVSIVVHSIELAEGDRDVLSSNEDGTCDFTMRVSCSSGTYIRTLADDIGRSLGFGGHLISLRRLRVGHFDLNDALTLEELESSSRAELESELFDGSSMVSHLPRVVLDKERVSLIGNGRQISLSESEAKSIEGSAGLVRLCDLEGRLVGIGEQDPGEALVRPRVVLTGE